MTIENSLGINKSSVSSIIHLAIPTVQPVGITILIISIIINF